MSLLRKITKGTVILFTHTHKIKSLNEELLLKMEKRNITCSTTKDHYKIVRGNPLYFTVLYYISWPKPHIN